MDTSINTSNDKQQAGVRPGSLAWTVISTEGNPELERLVRAAIVATGDAIGAEREPRPMYICAMPGAYEKVGRIDGIVEGSPPRCGFTIWAPGSWPVPEATVYDGRSAPKHVRGKRAKTVHQLVQFLAGSAGPVRPGWCVRIDRPKGLA